MMLTRLATYGVLFPLSCFLLLAGYWILIDRHWPVQEVRAAVVKTDGKTIRLARDVKKLRNCPTKTVEHFLVKGNGDKHIVWPLMQHAGQQRPAGEHTYLTTLHRPEIAPPGSYKVRVVVRFRCNPLKDNISISESEEFTMR